MKYFKHFLVSLFVLLCTAQLVLAQCVSDAGTFMGNLQFCEGDDLILTFPTDMFLDANDIAVFVVRTSSDPQSWNIMDITPNGTIPYNTGFLGESPFVVQVAVGNQSGGLVDLNDACTSFSDFITVEYSAAPVLSCADVTLNCAPTPPTSNCTVDQVDCTYDWDFLPGSNDPLQVNMVNGAGTYCFTTTNAFGCTVATCIEVIDDLAAPSFDLPSDLTIDCLSLPLFLTNVVPNNCTFAWSGPNGFFSSEQHPPITESGTYTVQVLGPNLCVNSGQVNVVVDVDGPDVLASGGTTDCLNGTATLSATSSNPNVTFEWFDSFGNIVPASGFAGTYTVVATNSANGCTNTATATINSNTDSPVIDVSASGTVLNCNNPVVTLTGSIISPANAVYGWYNQGVLISSDLEIQVNQTGTYRFEVQDPSNSCITAYEQVITEDFSIIGIDFQFSGPLVLDCVHTILTVTSQISTVTPIVDAIWYKDGSVFSNNQIITISQTGVYELIVTNAAGCTASEIFQVTGQNNAGISYNTLVNGISCNGANDGSIQILPSTSNVSFEWNNGFNDSQISSLSSGIYCVTMTDNDTGCTAVECFSINGPVPLQVILTQQSDSSGFFVTATTSGGFPPYDFQWQNGFTGNPFIVGPSIFIGQFYVTVTDANGCTGTGELVLGSGNFNQAIEGNVFQDVAQNCQFDAGDIGLSAWILRASNAVDTFYASSDAQGDYVLLVKEGSYVVETFLPNTYWSPCQSAYSVVVPQNDTIRQDIPILAQIACPDMEVSIATSQLRRCFVNNFYYVRYKNKGTVAASPAKIIVTLDPFMEFVSSQIPAVALGNNQYEFDLGTVEVSESGKFSIQVEVLCSASLGQSHCSEAHIYPDSLCSTPNPLWSGGNVEVRSECLGSNVHFIIKNTGTSAFTNGVDYIIVEDFVMLMQGQTPPLAPGDSLLLTFPANGSAYYLSAEQVPFHPNQSLPVAYLEACTVTGNFTAGLANQFTMGAFDPWIDVNCTVNQGSFDPNDKQGFPVGYGVEHYIEPNTPLEYLIRFQNTGTDTAFTVVIVDTLSPAFDISSIVPLASSHVYTFDLSDAGVMTYTFDDILLVDSTTNEPASHGFVRYAIKHRTDLPLETQLRNKAEIYFDFNEAVVTNTTLHTLGINFVTLGLWKPSRPNLDLSIQPNPFFEKARCTVKGLDKNEVLQVKVINMNGQIVQQFETQSASFELKRNALQSGIYFIYLSDNKGALGFGKIIVP